VRSDDSTPAAASIGGSHSHAASAAPLQKKGRRKPSALGRDDFGEGLISSATATVTLHP
jgi:hypothetical protein